jgi:lipid II:glycine glycyltransferase (peptidoglycan interpeptide bridge formation enzyme)
MYLRSLVPTELVRCDGASSFLQSGFWGSFKARFGWSARAFLAGWGEWGEKPLLVIHRPLGPGFSFAYVPWGPEFPETFPAGDEERRIALTELARTLRSFLPRDAAFIRFDPPWFSAGAETDAPPVGKPFSRSAADVQPPDTVLIDLRPERDAILAGMKPKGRYNIRLAEKKGVNVRRTGGEELDTFYRLFRETAKRDGIAIHGKEYYETLFSQSRDSAGEAELALYIAEHEGEPIAAVIVLFRGEEATYLYGASSDNKRNLMAPHLLQWTAMTDAKERGCIRYDLFGIPPRDDADHPMAGLYRFKTGFGGRIIHRPGSWDYTYKPLVKNLFSAAEGLRKGLRTIRKKAHK